MRFDFGQPADGLIQFAYVVADLEASVAEWTSIANVGPWFLRGPFWTNARYRGRPSSNHLYVGQAYSGNTMLELIQQLDDSPSVYREVVEQRGYGFHHTGIGTLDYEGQVARHESQGFETAYESTLPTGARLSYFDTGRPLGGMLEIVEITPAQEAVYSNVYRAAQGWDGSAPIRKH
ncbi:MULTISPECIES: VOC family protein [Microbacterium]|jgi:hypothetical protein|uniref:VOC family protein n=1 Tax=Microbacterium TaxID=33882 RepID=UPI001D177C8F|nr:VOC family protein [Microbacterium testaceum]MCC4250178.1 VOC family protein [Microbacterium testaceum]